MPFQHFSANEAVNERKTYYLSKARENYPPMFYKEIRPMPQGVVGKLGFEFVLDLGDHYVGKFSFSMDSVDDFIAAPVHTTIRFAEELARCWGNIDYGIKELSQDDGKSEMQAYAWDLETNAQSVQNFTNPHQREQGKKMVTLSSQRDIYENNANMATRRLRSRILAILPSWFVEDAIAECKKTLAGQNDMPLIDRVKKMVVQFAKLGVTQEQIEKRLKRKIDSMNADDFTSFVGIFNAIKQGESKIADWFETETVASDLTNELNAVL
jgi:hypothetical protein